MGSDLENSLAEQEKKGWVPMYGGHHPSDERSSSRAAGPGAAVVSYIKALIGEARPKGENPLITYLHKEYLSSRVAPLPYPRTGSPIPYPPGAPKRATIMDWKSHYRQSRSE